MKGEEVFLRCTYTACITIKDYMVNFFEINGRERFCFVSKDDVVGDENPLSIAGHEGLVKVTLFWMEKKVASIGIKDANTKSIQQYNVEATRLRF